MTSRSYRPPSPVPLHRSPSRPPRAPPDDVWIADPYRHRPVQPDHGARAAQRHRPGGQLRV